MSDKVCLNGRIVERGKARISVMDYGLLYGYGLFETMRSYSGVVFKLEDHFERLEESARDIGIGLSKMLPTLEDSIYDTLKANGRADAYVRLTVTCGEGRPRINFSEKAKPNFFIITDELPDYRKQYRIGVELSLSKTVSQTRLSHTPRLKTLNYLDRIMARMEASEKGFFDALIRDEDGLVAEAATSNIFSVKDGVVTTPPEGSILPGITRKTVIEIAVEEGLEVKAEGILLKKILGADEVFMTNSIAQILPVTRIDHATIGNGKPGETTKKISRGYQKKVEAYLSKSKRIRGIR